MSLTLAIETSKPNGTTFRLALGCTVPLAMVSMFVAIARLF